MDVSSERRKRRGYSDQTKQEVSQKQFFAIRAFGENIFHCVAHRFLTMKQPTHQPVAVTIDNWRGSEVSPRQFISACNITPELFYQCRRNSELARDHCS